ncbi:MAG: primosomal protein N' [Chloroflexota bacterium]|nr:primosomal protein N' [Chloroflexota bacterium]
MMERPSPVVRRVEVAVDASGVPGGQSFTYHLPPGPELGGVGPGDAVLVPYGRRQVVGVVLGEGDPTSDRATKPVLARIHGEPLLPPLQARLAAFVARYYLAPPGMVVRAMLPPGLLERAELVACRPTLDSSADQGDTPAMPETKEGSPTASPDDPCASLVSRIDAAGPQGIAVDLLPADPDRAALLRTLRQAEAAGHLELEWRLRRPGARPRERRVARLSAAGLEVARELAGSRLQAGRPLGPRQRALIEELAEGEVVRAASGGVAAADLAARHGASAVTGLARRGLLDLDTTTVQRRPVQGQGATARGSTERGSLPTGAELRPEQRELTERVEALVTQRRPEVVLLEGGTASGKTAVYSAAVASALRHGLGAIVLVPEISLATPLLDRLRHDLGVDPALLHSALSEGERADEWRRIRSGETNVVVGTRIAVLAPLAEPGVVIVDEEHDAAYKSDRTPRYQARDVAIELGRLAGVPVILGSATPDVVSLGRAEQGLVEHHRLVARSGIRSVPVEVIDLRAELATGNRGLISAALAAALEELDRSRGERAILVINRRGSASVVLCRDCGYVQVCPECQRPLVFHATAMALRCHHCGASAPTAQRCPACTSVRIRYLGGGTERVEREVALRSPGLRVGRLDRDVVERKGAAARVVDDFAEGRLDVLVGTSLVTKGLDVPEVTLVGVVSADVGLNLPDERAAERTYQLLTQAVGRAGRGDLPGRALIQTYQPEHPAIRAVADGDGRDFIAGQLALRRTWGSPPFGSVIKLTVALPDRDKAMTEARRLAADLRGRAAEHGGRTAVLGPAPAYIVRRAGRWRFHVVLRGSDPAALLGGDPGPPWSVDVDPESLM